jgi:hypothetical protein
MKYTDSKTFTTQELSILETLQELEDVVHIAKMMCRGIHKDGDMPDSARGDAESAYKNLDEAEHYIPYLRKKIKIALEHVPNETQEKEYL